MSTHKLYIKDARVWIPHADTVWEGAQLTADFRLGDRQLTVVTDAQRTERTLTIRDESDLPPLRNPAILIGQNDLTALSYLHEPDVLHNLEVRFCKRQTIYTYCGIVLVAINPYADLPLYGPGVIGAYRGHAMGELEPHIFAVAEEAYARLERERCNLSIIVSGESGAGKTVSAKYAMRYFAAVGGSESETQIERKVLASSPIMEAIGNAKTTRNDNSSRFGKFTKLLFADDDRSDSGAAGGSLPMALTGGSMQTYLLEKSRVVFQAAGERNYHVFYQLCAAREQWPELRLAHQDAFRFLNQGESPDISRVSDRDAFTETETAFRTLGFGDADVREIVGLLASILHLGNIEFAEQPVAGDGKRTGTGADQDASCEVSAADEHLRTFAAILQLDAADLRRWLVTRRIESIGDVVLIPMNRAEADGARNALAKHMYARLFQHVVNVINRSLDASGGTRSASQTSLAGGSAARSCFIGVLDIYGFETFRSNSFEQFCINYANEKLQQQFNQHVFKLEQDNYLSEGIVWTMIDFYDNQPCIDMIESKLGILDLLDEECRMPGGSDESWVGKLIEKCAKYTHFDKPRYGTVSFFVKHFSDTVQYESHGFLEKNRDTVSKELVNVLRAAKQPLCQRLMNMDDATADGLRDAKSNTSLNGRVVISASKTLLVPNKQHKQTVGSQFRDSLSSLIATLHSTTPHYVRCIKPNDDKHAFKWDAPKIVQQLRACGVLETIRISAAGFPSRWLYEKFYARYALLCRRSQITDDDDLPAICGHIVRNHITDEDKCRFGRTQIFFRAGQVAYLEQVRTETRRHHIVLVQSLVRRFVCRLRFQRLRRTALGLQAHARGMLARRRLRVQRETRAAITLQRYVRGWLQRRRFRAVRRSVLGLQTHGRGLLARQRFRHALDEHKATQVQRFWRGILARRRAAARLRAIVVCQAAVRRFLARRQYRRLRAEARTITHIQKMYKGLENKIISLQQRIDELTRAKNALSRENQEIPALRTRLDAMRTLEAELKLLRGQLDERNASLEQLDERLDRERDEKMSVLVDRDRERSEWDEQRRALHAETEAMRAQINGLIDGATGGASSAAVSLRTRKISEADTEGIHQAYQRALKDKEAVEKENAALKQELRSLSRLQPPSAGTHSRSVSNASSINNDDDFGYASGRNTLEARRNGTHSAGSGAMLSPPPAQQQPANQSSPSSIISSTTTGAEQSPDAFGKRVESASTPRASELVLLMKLRRMFEEERDQRQQLESKLVRLKSASGTLNTTEESLKASELEVENDKLRTEYALLRNSITRGVQSQELEAQYAALQEDHKRRRDECIQLRACLAQQSQSLRSIGASGVVASVERFHDDGELIEAYKAQKLVNRQLEAELTAVTEQSNAKLTELTGQNDALRTKCQQLEAIFERNVRTADTECPDSGDGESDGGPPAPVTLETLQQNEAYLRHELQQVIADNVASNEQLSAVQAKLARHQQRNRILAQRLRDNGLDSSAHTDDRASSSDGAAGDPAIKRPTAPPSYQGILKFDRANRVRIVQKLIVDLTPRVAITLLPGLPAYAVFMCIRYTDLLNADQEVRALLADFIKQMKRIYRHPHPVDQRILWLVNCLRLHNLLKQYGGIGEYVKLNTDAQNQQQLKNFDLSEYHTAVLDTICGLHEQTVRQVQDELRPFVVPAILDHDEISRGRSTHGIRSTSGRPTPTADGASAADPKAFVQQLDRFHRQFEFFGLDGAYVEQIYMQLMHYVCVIALNNLMLRQQLCNWKTGIQIRYNLNSLEEWVRKKNMPNDVLKFLQPLIQASLLLQWLLQPRRSADEDVETVAELCSSLSTEQVLKIMKSYTQEDGENPIQPAFIEQVEARLRQRQMPTSNDGFTMDERHVQPFRVGYKYDDIRLEDIELPDILNVGDLLQKI